MRKARIDICPSAMLMFAVLFYLSDTKEFLAFVLPVAVHELGHIAVIRLLGLRIYGFEFELSGLRIDYSGYTGYAGHAAAALAGPAAGFAYSFAASGLGNRMENPVLCLSAGISLILSAFNMLPALPLDGGRAALYIGSALWGERKGEYAACIVSTFIGATLLAAGIFLMHSGYGAAVLLAAVWLLIFQDTEGLVKKRKVM